MKKEVTVKFTEVLEDYIFELTAKIDGSTGAELTISRNNNGKSGECMVIVDLSEDEMERLAYLFDHAPREIKKLEELA